MSMRERGAAQTDVMRGDAHHHACRRAKQLAEGMILWSGSRTTERKRHGVEGSHLVIRGGERRAAGDAKLLKDSAEMNLDGRLADREPIGELLVTHAGRG